MATSTKNKVGRPVKYSQELADKIIDLILEGKSERKIGAMKGMPSRRTIIRWKEENEEFCHRSAQARKESSWLFDALGWEQVERLNRIADRCIKTGVDLPKGYVEAKKIVIQECARQAAMRNDENFGDRKKVAITGKDGKDLNVAPVLVIQNDLKD